MTYIEIPASVSNIVNGAFYACSLGCVVVDSGNLVYDSRNNCNAIIETASNKLIVGSQNAVIPDDVTNRSLRIFLLSRKRLIFNNIAKRAFNY